MIAQNRGVRFVITVNITVNTVCCSMGLAIQIAVQVKKNSFPQAFEFN